MQKTLQQLREEARIRNDRQEYCRLTAAIRYAEKPEECKAAQRAYRARLTPDQKRAQYLYSKAGIESDPVKLERRRAQAKKWRVTNPEKFKESVRKCRKNPYYSKKRLWDMNVLSYLVKPDGYQAMIRRGRKAAAIDHQEVFGCLPSDFRKHMGDRFPGCTLDHIIPASRFDITTKEGLKLAYHYTNLRWLPARANQLKAAR